MGNVFSWLQMGFKVYNNNGSTKNLKDIKSHITLESLTEMFASGYYFFNKTHRVKVSNMEEYNTYFGKVQ